MINVAEELAHVELGEPVHFRNMTIFPLLPKEAERPTEPDYLLAEDAIAHGLAHITELSDGGSVPELRFENQATIPVLLLDGEELIGAKQNRVLNLTILAPAKRSIVIPVSCVEAGRWQFNSVDFEAAPRVMFARARAAKADQVSASMAASGVPRSDQGAVWSEIRSMADRLQASSPTERMSAIFERHAATTEEFVRAFPLAESQAGALFAIDGRIAGLDLFDRSATMQRVLPKLVRSYALDAIDAGGERRATTGDAKAFLGRIARAKMRTAAAAGIGKDVRLAATDVSGAALWALGRYVHLCAFDQSNGTKHEGWDGMRSRIARPSARRRTE